MDSSPPTRRVPIHTALHHLDGSITINMLSCPFSSTGDNVVPSTSSCLPDMLLDDVMEASFDSVFLTNLAGTNLKVNRIADEKFGYDHVDELVGNNISIVIGGPGAARHVQYFSRQGIDNQDTIEQVLNRMRDVRGRTKQGSEFHVQVGIRVVQGRGYFAFSHDLSRNRTQQTAIKEGQKAVMAKERIMRSVLDSAFDSIIVTDELGTP